MNTTQTARTQAALTAMIRGKLLFNQEKRIGIITHSYIFLVPGSPHEHCVLTITSGEHPQRISQIESDFPSPEALLRELVAGGKYQDYREISISSPDAQRVLAMFRNWVLINNLRHGINQPLEPSSDEGDLSVHYA